MENTNTETLLKFPEKFPIKIMGKNNVDLSNFVQEIIKKHIKTEDFVELRENTSKDGNFISLTLVAIFHDKESLDQVYIDLSSNPLVLMAL